MSVLQKVMFKKSEVKSIFTKRKIIENFSAADKISTCQLLIKCSQCPANDQVAQLGRQLSGAATIAEAQQPVGTLPFTYQGSAVFQSDVVISVGGG